MKKLVALLALGALARGFVEGVKRERKKHEQMTDDYVELTKKMAEEAEKAKEEIDE